MAVNLHLVKWRFGADDGTEAAHTFLAAENASADLFVNTNYLLRIGIQQTEATAAANLVQQFRYNLNGAGWVNITTTSAVVKAVAVGAFTNGQASTTRLTLTGSPDTSNANCTEDGSSGGNANDVPVSGHSETVLGFQVVSGAVARGDTIQFDVTVSGPTTTITLDVTPTSTVAGNVSLAIASGTFVETGTAIGLKTTRKIAAASGAFVLTGTHVDLTEGGGLTHYTLPIAPGAFSLSGTQAGVKAARKMALASGNFSLSGTATALKTARKLTISPGTFVETGTAVGLLAKRKLSLVSGIFALSGTNIALKTSRKLPVASGEFSLVGSHIGLTYAPVEGQMIGRMNMTMIINGHL